MLAIEAYVEIPAASNPPLGKTIGGTTGGTEAKPKWLASPYSYSLRVKPKVNLKVCLRLLQVVALVDFRFPTVMTVIGDTMIVINPSVPLGSYRYVNVANSYLPLAFSHPLAVSKAMPPKVSFGVPSREPKGVEKFTLKNLKAHLD